MKKIRGIIYKILILIDAVRMAIPLKKQVCKSREILIVYSGCMGDGLIDASAIRAIVDKFSAEGKRVSIMAIRSCCKIFEMLLTTCEVSLIPCDLLVNNFETIESRKIFRDTVRKLQEVSWERIIVQFNSVKIKPTVFTFPVPAAQKSAYIYAKKPSRLMGQIKFRLIQCFFDKVVTFTDDQTQMQFSQDFARCMGVEQFPFKISRIPKLPVALRIDQPYITITVDSSRSAKQWPVERFIELVRKLLKQYAYDVVITGGNMNAVAREQYETAFRDISRVKNSIGKTDLREWIELIRGARFHIGVDSGSIHVAASVGTQAFCLTGMWDMHRFFPYQIEEDTPETAVPVCIYRSDVNPDALTCGNCASHGKFGCKNRKCYKLCKNGNPNLCLQNITVDDVMRTIEQVMKGGTE